MAISKWKKTIGTVLQQVCNYETVNYNEDILIPYGWESMAPSPSKERKTVYDIRRLVYTTWQRNRIENSKLNEIDGISSAKRAFHRLCSSNRDGIKELWKRGWDGRKENEWSWCIIMDHWTCTCHALKAAFVASCEKRDGCAPTSIFPFMLDYKLARSRV